MEQKINLILIGGTHFKRKSDMIYEGMRCFRRFNATIEVKPLFCEQEFYAGFPKKWKIIYIILKTDSFSLEIFGKINF